MERILVLLAGLFGMTGVGLGAFGAHGLRTKMAALPDGVQRMEWWNTAAHYHLIHALAIGLAAWVVSRTGGSGAAGIAGWLFALGIVLFSGSLYVMTLTGVRALGAVTPLGGLSMMIGWLLLMFGGLAMRR